MHSSTVLDVFTLFGKTRFSRRFRVDPSRSATPSLFTNFASFRSISKPFSAIFCKDLSHTIIDRVPCHESRLQPLANVFTSPLKPDRALVLHSSEVVKILLEGAGRMMRNGMWQTKLKRQTTFPDS
ncbi:hypothetical protein BLNAU_1413 [Blattamonas nauphoetae]|uniref:Uncharacterized protein n=1 Tax=Blattamonas nauphoetae TaxID=2049346 RepID=A0ABQ9YJT8_9EUKA|nr:hypothetical protein BLNAU_1413 [Blattamonas nauphoetae]